MTYRRGRLRSLGTTGVLFGGRDTWNVRAEEWTLEYQQPIGISRSRGRCNRSTLRRGISTLRSASLRPLVVVVGQIWPSGSTFRLCDHSRPTGEVARATRPQRGPPLALREAEWHCDQPLGPVCVAITPVGGEGRMSQRIDSGYLADTV